MMWYANRLMKGQQLMRKDAVDCLYDKHIRGHPFRIIRFIADLTPIIGAAIVLLLSVYWWAK